jgi:Ca2+-dependent lipid-binding protein
MMELMSKGQEWYNLAGVKTGRAKMTVQWKPVSLKGALGGSGGYVTPIGVIRLHLQSAKDLRNMETLGKSDPYVRVMLSGIMKGRTVTFKNNLNPDWDEVIYVPVHSTREKLVLEVMDEEKLGKDRSLGMVELAAADYIHQEESGEYAVMDSKRSLSLPLRMGPKAAPKGFLNFTASFFPTLDVMDPEEEEQDIATDFEVVGSSMEPTAGRARSSTVGTVNSLKSPSVEMANRLADNEKQQAESILSVKREVPRIRLGVDDLSSHGTLCHFCVR